MSDIPLNEVSNVALWPLVVYFVAVIALVLTMLGLSWILGQQRANAATNDPFESGIVSVGSAQGRISVDFYLIAIFFVIFDLETVFIFAWAIAFFELGWQGYFAMLAFVFVLVIALIYEWRSGALEWGVKTRTTLPSPLENKSRDGAPLATKSSQSNITESA
ncbi:MAG: NADH-quinone oxidoreductase subunit A [Arenicella sp.]|nr:NADH-quinone oxidoreductase subunit A [Arenicella sp.]